MRRYGVFGLTIVSEIELPELIAASEGAPVDVTVRFAPVPPLEPGRHVTFDNGEVRLQCDGAGRYRATGGSAIEIDREAGATDEAIRLYLLGSALGAIIHQRGLLPLHANAIVFDGRAVAFAASPGGGKSTLAAWFYDQGNALLSDDVCVVQPSEGGYLAHPGVPRLRLWRDSLEASGRAVADHAQAFDGFDKYLVGMRDKAATSPVPLSHIYFLKAAPEGELNIRRLAGSSAVQALSENTYRGFYVRGLGKMERHLQQCTELARSIPIFVVTRPFGFDRLAADARALREHARSVIAS